MTSPGRLAHEPRSPRRSLLARQLCEALGLARYGPRRGPAVVTSTSRRESVSGRRRRVRPRRLSGRPSSGRPTGTAADGLRDWSGDRSPPGCRASFSPPDSVPPSTMASPSTTGSHQLSLTMLVMTHPSNVAARSRSQPGRTKVGPACVRLGGVTTSLPLRQAAGGAQGGARPGPRVGPCLRHACAGHGRRLEVVGNGGGEGRRRPSFGSRGRVPAQQAEGGAALAAELEGAAPVLNPEPTS
jgi:hypothetical protein